MLNSSHTAANFSFFHPAPCHSITAVTITARVSLLFASQDALEVVWVSQATDRDFIDVTLVNEDTYGDDGDDEDNEDEDDKAFPEEQMSQPSSWPLSSSTCAEIYSIIKARWKQR